MSLEFKAAPCSWTVIINIYRRAPGDPTALFTSAAQPGTLHAAVPALVHYGDQDQENSPATGHCTLTTRLAGLTIVLGTVGVMYTLACSNNSARRIVFEG